MIHISIPTFQTFVEKYDSHKKYNVYDLYVNGSYHASVRYSTLYSLHEKLLETFGLRLGTAEFPPKKIWRNLDAEGAIKRKDGLVKYFKTVLQNQDIARHPLFERHFLEFQVSSFMPAVSGVKLELFLPDGTVIHIDCRSDDSTDIVLRKAGNFLGISASSINSFGIFLARPRLNGEQKRSDEGFDPICVRWLRNFESPFISQQVANRNIDDGAVHYELGLRRAIWDPSLEESLLDDQGALKLLFLQARNDIDRGLIRLNSSTRARLASLEEQELYRQYMHLCHQQVDYGYEYLPSISMDYPWPGNVCSLKIGRHQLVIEYEDKGQLCEHVIRSTRIRVWKVSQNDETKDMTFQVEYLIDRDNFKEITMHTNKSVLLALFLQSIANEILRENNGRITPIFRFDDEVQTRVIESLESSKADSVIGDDLLEDTTYTDTMAVDITALFKVISHQMPFENESFEHITNAEL
ncbi:unnamed protein product [Bursaphelenchus xylophilus]|uniref:(pine wood nematode) hypothetical protein n=1 Tax=Bursaphelenchus xylophilus TaxID=6326 RepID=A0A1I7SD60_BURXY|nr:unnamed protein product [Bursaphelenchus xylophilus]CAG9130512.1 unnamed protein product [Bursaphelenchus xylophilus]